MKKWTMAVVSSLIGLIAVIFLLFWYLKETQSINIIKVAPILLSPKKPLPLKDSKSLLAQDCLTISQDKMPYLTLDDFSHFFPALGEKFNYSSESGLATSSLKTTVGLIFIQVNGNSNLSSNFCPVEIAEYFNNATYLVYETTAEKIKIVKITGFSHSVL